LWYICRNKTHNMRNLINHLLRCNEKEIADKSILNCHVKGLHSIMLLDAPGKTIRLYVTDKTHTLHSNYINPQSLSFHPHHCELTLNCMFGEFTNIEVKVENDLSGNDCKEYDRWIYNSQISTGNPIGFVKDGSDILRVKQVDKVMGGKSIYMPASAIHTVCCPENTINAWVVFEGREWSNYKPVAWSNHDLTNIDKEGLYIKPTIEQIKDLLKSVRII